MTVARIAISLDAELARKVKGAAGKQSTSAWLADAARRKLRADGLLRTVAAWESEHGEITAAEMDRARKKRARR
ncbi:MAG: hypothetical protein ACRELY_31340 [Polyangiaceae bacterium]